MICTRSIFWFVPEIFSPWTGRKTNTATTGTKDIRLPHQNVQQVICQTSLGQTSTQKRQMENSNCETI